jgi:hypothetical protein
MASATALSVVLATLVTLGFAPQVIPSATAAPAATAFEQAFANPDSDAKPFVRWWIAPGRMNEDEVRKEIKNFADGGYAGVELQTLELCKPFDCINTPVWNETMKWILKAGLDYGVQIDFTLGQFWPIATPEITNADDDRAEQQIWSKAIDFTAAPGAMDYTTTAYEVPFKSGCTVTPWGTFCSVPGMDSARDYEFIAVTAAQKLPDGSLDPATAVDLLAPGQATFNSSTGAINWTAPTAGDWGIYWFYRQSSGKQLGYGMTQYVVDHMSKAATDAVIANWENAMTSDPELKALYEQNAGSFFGDSFELSSSLWTVDMLDEFKARRGYDLTPYLPAISANMSGITDRIRDDLYATMTELLAENHMGAFSAWAKTHNMTLRYQAYSSAGAAVFELTDPALATDIIEVESYAMGGPNPDTYRQLSGAVNMRGDKLFTAETGEVGNDSWRTTWTNATLQNGSVSNNRGFMYYAYRNFAAGVNKNIFHGATYKFTDTSSMYFPVTQSWPGYSAMAALSYGNEWDDKTPMWANVDVMTDALSRYQYVLQQGQADVDLAFYRSQFGKGNTQSAITAVEQAGYTYDYVTPTVLDLPKATTGTEGGKTVLAADGPSYKAIVIEPLTSGGTASEMPLATANKILGWAQAGLPVVIVGAAPSKVNSYPGDDASVGSTSALTAADAQLATIMGQLQALPNVKTATDRADLIGKLAALGVAPDAKPGKSANIYFNHRATTDADLWYLYNDSSSAIELPVSFLSSGSPYLLDAWSGEVIPIAEYSTKGGRITFDVSLGAQDAILVAIAKNGWASKSVAKPATASDADAVVFDEVNNSVALRGSEAGRVSAVLSDGSSVSAVLAAPDAPQTLSSWKMVFGKWQQSTAAGAGVFDTEVVDSAEYDLTSTGLKPWYEIDATNLKNVGGVARYTTTFTLTKGWADGQGAYLTFTDIADVGRLFVNGQEVGINQISLTTDIGKYLVKGSNTLAVEVSSNLANYVYGTSPANTWQFGILGDVTLTPYSQAVFPKTEPKPTPTPKVTVKVPAKPAPTYVTKVKFGQSKVTLAKGKSVTIRPGVYFTKGAATYTSRVTYKSSNPKVAKVDAYGNVKALKAGTAKITATSKLTAKNGKKLSATYTVTVVKKGTKTKVSKLTLPGVPKTLKLGQTLWLTASYTAKGNAQPVKVTYTSLKSGIAGIDAVGKLTGVSKGKDTIVVKAGGKTTKYTITVK